jgi:hypothetical protein
MTPMIPINLAVDLDRAGNAACSQGVAEDHFRAIRAAEDLARSLDLVEIQNQDATPKYFRMIVSRDKMPEVLEWYHSFYYGDDYTVTVNGRTILLGRNGEPLEEKN